MDVRSIAERRFDAQKLNLFSTARFFLDVYCLEAGQAQAPHHTGAEKVCVLLQGAGHMRVGDEERALAPREGVLCAEGASRAVSNPGPGQAALPVLMAPRR